jgi:hypothetical protein
VEEERLCSMRKDPRVPLLIKVPGQTTPDTYDSAMDAVLIHDVISAWMAGRGFSVPEIRALFDRGRSRFPVHEEHDVRSAMRQDGER